MDTVFLARHAESELSAREVVNGDPSVPCGLTPLGEEQALELGRQLSGAPVELAVTSDFDRCRLTARIALADRQVRWLELATLGDVHAGRFEGGALDDYRAWARATSAREPAPGGGESRVAVAARIAHAARELLARTESTALVVSHQVVVAYLLSSARGATPAPRVEPVPHARALRLDARELRRAAETLEAWAAAPDW